MKQLKRKALRIFFGAEIIFFCVSYLFGGNGLPALRALNQEVAALEQDMSALSQEIEQLEVALAQQAEPFYKEKVAREQLQMARKGDQIFIIAS